MSKLLTIRCSDRLTTELRLHAHQRSITQSEAIRDLIRRGLGMVTSSYDAGYEEGKLAAWREHMKQLNGVE